MTTVDQGRRRPRRREHPLSHAQLTLLRAIATGHVAWRHDAARGWAIRRRDVPSSGPGGKLGTRVNGAVQQLARRGLVAVPEPAGSRDTPITLTSAGQIMLELANLDGTARDDAAAAPHLAMTQDGREPFPAGVDGDAPIGAVLDLTDLGYPGRWQRQGEFWVPVADTPTITTAQGRPLIESTTINAFAVRDRRGYWLTPNGWGEHADARRFDELLDAWIAAAELSDDLWSLDNPQPRPWSVAEGCRAVVEPCTSCQATGRETEDNPYYLKRGFDERVCPCCWGYGSQAIVGLSTVQMSCGGRPGEHAIHLVRDSFHGCPGPLLCGVDFRAKGGPACNIGGGTSGPGHTNTPCAACAAAAAADFPGLPVSGMVGGLEMAALIGVPHNTTGQYERPWRDEAYAIRHQLTARAGR